MQAIVTKYLGPTNTRGSRIVARCDAGSVSFPYPHELSGEECHAAAALALCRKLGWTRTNNYKGRLVCGSAPQKGSPHAYVFVFTRTTGGISWPVPK